MTPVPPGMSPVRTTAPVPPKPQTNTGDINSQLNMDVFKQMQTQAQKPADTTLSTTNVQGLQSEMEKRAGATKTPKEEMVERLASATSARDSFNFGTRFKELETERGTAEMRKQVGSFEQEIAKTNTLLDTLEKDLGKRVGDFNVSEAEKNRILASERKPLLEGLGIQERGLSGVSGRLEREEANILTQLGLEGKDAGADLENLKTEFGIRTDIEKLFEPKKEEAGFTLSPGEMRFDKEGNIVAKGGPKSPSEAEITKSLERAEKSESARSTQVTAVSLVNSILGSSDLGTVSGVSRLGLSARIASTAGVRAQLAQLKAITALEGREKLKGTGTISDREQKTLEDAANSLNFAIQDDGRIAMSDEEVEQNLKNIRGVLLSKTGTPVSVIATDPSTGESKQFDNVSKKDIEDAAIQGFIIDYM